MASGAGVRENPDRFAERLYEQLVRHRELHFSKFEGEPEQIDELKAHIRHVEPLPTMVELKTLVETTFYASISKEEGADVNFSLLWSNPQMAAESEWPRLQFECSLPLDVELLRKLSPASDPNHVDICAFLSENGPEIWGLLFLRERSPRGRGYPPGLTFIVDGPGTLIVKMGSQLVGTYSMGIGVVLNEDEQVDQIGLMQLLAKIFSDDRDGREKLFAAGKVLNFANEALLAGQGATLLVTIGDMSPASVNFPKYATECVSREDLASRLADNKFLYLSTSMSRIALVDGAVVMNEFGVVFGFGGMIRTSNELDFEVLVADSRNFKGKGKSIKLSEFSGGSRHRSALSFCYDNPGAAALVVSHDGIMSVMTRPLNENRVVVFRPFYRTFELGI